MLLDKELVILVVFQVVRLLHGLLLDPAKGLAEFADKHCLCQASRNGIGSQELVELLHLSLVHAQTTDCIHRQLFLAEAAVAVVLNDVVVLVAHRKRALHGGLCYSVPVRVELLHQPLFQPVQPLFPHRVSDLKFIKFKL